MLPVLFTFARVIWVLEKPVVAEVGLVKQYKNEKAVSYSRRIHLRSPNVDDTKGM